MIALVGLLSFFAFCVACRIALALLTRGTD